MVGPALAPREGHGAHEPQRREAKERPQERRSQAVGRDRDPGVAVRRRVAPVGKQGHEEDARGGESHGRHHRQEADGAPGPPRARDGLGIRRSRRREHAPGDGGAEEERPDACGGGGGHQPVTVEITKQLISRQRFSAIGA